MVYVSWIFPFFRSFGHWTNPSKNFVRWCKIKKISLRNRLHHQTQISTHLHPMMKTIWMKTTITTTWWWTVTPRRCHQEKTAVRRNTTSSKTCIRNLRSKSKGWESHHQLHQAETLRKVVSRHLDQSKVTFDFYVDQLEFCVNKNWINFRVRCGQSS